MLFSLTNQNNFVSFGRGRFVAITFFNIFKKRKYVA